MAKFRRQNYTGGSKYETCVSFSQANLGWKLELWEGVLWRTGREAGSSVEPQVKVMDCGAQQPSEGTRGHSGSAGYAPLRGPSPGASPEAQAAPPGPARGGRGYCDPWRNKGSRISQLRGYAEGSRSILLSQPWPRSSRMCHLAWLPRGSS